MEHRTNYIGIKLTKVHLHLASFAVLHKVHVHHVALQEKIIYILVVNAIRKIANEGLLGTNV